MRRRRFTAIFGIAALLLISACRASGSTRLSEKATSLAHDGKYAEAIAALQKLKVDFRDSQEARGADKRILLYRGLLEADIKEKRRRAKDDMTAIARSLLQYSEAHARYPARIEEIAGGGLLSSTDPWGREYRYTTSADGKRYRLGCLGADGAPGGEGDDHDLMVDTGNFVENLSWVDQ